MVRLYFVGDDVRGLSELTFTDHYVKLLFPPAGADYRWPFDPEQIRAERPAEEWPVTRTYTIRSFDPATGELAIDFVVHGDAGLAGPWAAAVEPGESIGFHGPGGGYAPIRLRSPISWWVTKPPCRRSRPLWTCCQRTRPRRSS